ncbi:hypothetical protein ZTR_09844 [Talaromyces verruculosus]|nr:hypothetical protein ZTR_09844 [Talaromyces verruculosus]
MSQSIASHPPWKQALLNRMQDLKTALVTDDLDARQTTLFHATNSRAPATHFSKAGIDEQWTALKAITEGAARNIESGMTSFKSDIESGTYDSYRDDESRFIGAIKERINQAKDQINKAIDKATDDLIDQISNLPESQQDFAGDVVSDSLDIVGNAYDMLVSVFGSIMGEIHQIMFGHFDSLEKGYSKVKNNVDICLKAIDKAFNS